ncbi:MAG: nucleotidyltransferase domain-containing protein [Pseudomonadales bacterium]
MHNLNLPPDHIITQTIEEASANPDIVLLWLYGSRAQGTASPTSDYDFAVAFIDKLKNPLDRRLRPELMAMDWQAALQISEKGLSVVDINQAPLPLALNIISNDSKLLLNKDELRYTRELTRIWGLWSDSQWRYDQQRIQYNKHGV